MHNALLTRSSKAVAWFAAVSLALMALVPSASAFENLGTFKYSFVSQSGALSADGKAHVVTANPGDTIPMSLTIKNRSTNPKALVMYGKSALLAEPGMPNAHAVGLGTSHPRDIVHSWIDPTSFQINGNRFAYYDGQPVNPGENLTLTFNVKVAGNAAHGIYDLYTEIVREWDGWAVQVDAAGRQIGNGDIFWRFNVGNVNVPTTPGNVTVSTASSNPAASTLIEGQALADLAHFQFNGTGTVTNVTLNRTGVSADSTLSSVYLFEGANRLTDAATVSAGKITFNAPAGLFTVSGSKNVSVRANIADGTASQTVGVSLASASLSSGTVSGTATGNLHTVADPGTGNFATVEFATTTTPASASIQPQDDYVIWQNSLSVGVRKVWLKSLRLRQIGSINSTDVNNFRLYIDGTHVGSAVANLDSNGYVTFDLGSGVALETGSRQVKVLADIDGGSGRTFSFSLQQTADVMVVDSQFNQPVLVTGNGSTTTGTFAAHTSGTQTISGGTLTINKRSDSPSGNVVNTASNAVLGRFDVKAAGEAIKVENLSVRIDEDDTDTAYTLRNGAVYWNGVQVGSTTALAADNDATQAYTTYNFGSSFVVQPGQTGVLEIRADVYDSDGTNDVAANDTIQVELVAGSSNAQRMTSLDYINFPTATVEGNVLTVATGTLTVAMNSAYANRTIVAPQQAYKIGSYNIQASSTEGATITGLTVDFDEVADAADASDDLTNLYMVVGGTTTAIKASVTDTANTYSVNVPIAAGQTLTADVYADVAASSTDGDGTADTFESSLTVSYTTTGSGNSTSASEVDGQTITSGSGSFTTAVDGSTPLARIVAGNQEVEAARFRFTATSDTYTIKELQVKVGDATVATTVQSVKLYDGATLLGTATITQGSGTAALFTGLNVSVPAGSFKTLTVKLVLNTIGAGAGSSQQNAAVTLDHVKYANSQGVEATDTTDRAGNEMYVYRSIPTVNFSDVTNSAIINGQERDLYKFTVTADAAGPISLKQFKLAVVWNDNATTADTLEIHSIKLLRDNVDITAAVDIQNEDGDSVEGGTGTAMVEADSTIAPSWLTSTEATVAAGTTTTFTIRGTISGFSDSSDSVSMNLLGDSAHNGTDIYLADSATGLIQLAGDTSETGASDYNFIWSDNSGNPHNATVATAGGSGDWANGYLVNFLPLAGETFVKVP